MTILRRVLSPPLQEECDHGITFDLEVARQIVESFEHKRLRARIQYGAAVDYVLGDVDASSLIKERWPRGWFTKEKPCPKGCGYIGIYYASYEHYIMGDW